MAYSEIYFLIISVIFNVLLCYGDQNVWHSYQFDSGYANREELVITDVNTDNEFKINENVLYWKTLSGNRRVYGVGVLHNAVIILNIELSEDSNNFVITKKLTELQVEINYAEIFEHWNTESRKLEIILILSTFNNSISQLNWYKINDVNLEYFWTWPIHKRISHMRFFNLDTDKYRLLIINDTLDLYEFVLNAPKPNFWLSQTITLSSPADNSALNFYGSDTYLSIPQNQQNEVRLYKLKGQRFEFWNKITSQNVTQVISFKIGFKSFLAVNGENSAIYKFIKDNIELENVNGIHLTNADFWFPIPIKTYRDEVALILQRSIEHVPHHSHFINVMLYDGSSFVIHDQIPCLFYGEKQEGLDCMIDEDEHYGLLGAATVSLKDVLGVLVPHKMNSVLFMIHTVLRKLKSPIEIEIEKLSETRKQLEKMIADQKAEIESIQKRTEKPIQPSNPSAWKEINTPFPVYQENITTSRPLSDDLIIDLEELRTSTDNLKRNLDETKEIFRKTKINKSQHLFDTLTLFGGLDVLGEVKFGDIQTLTINNEDFEELLGDVVNKNRVSGSIFGHKIFKDLTVQSIAFNTSNGISAEDLIYENDHNVTINGSLIFEKTVDVSGDVTTTEGVVNNMNLFNEIVEMKKSYNDSFEFEHVRILDKLNTPKANKIPIQKSFKEIVGDVNPNSQTIELESVKMVGDITVENVNGENFEEFKKSLCLKNVETYIPGETIMAGDLHVIGSADIQFLNGLRFPEDYILKNSEYSRISGEKNFIHQLYTDELIVEDSINGIKPESMITLSTNQSLPGTFKFNDLEVTNAMNVEGNITGPFMDKFLRNPSLLESNTINAKANIKTIFVNGNIIVGNNYNGKKLEELLSDVVYVTDGYALINSVKNFSKGVVVTNGLTTSSQKINSIPISTIITKNTEQTISMKTLNGAVVFQNLFIEGLYGNINITKLDEETVKLSGDQFISSTLLFTNKNDALVDLSATEMEIFGTLNELPSSHYFYKKGENTNMDFNSLGLDKIRASNVVVEGNLEGFLEDFALKEFDERRLSVTREQEVSAKYSIKKLYAESFIANAVNGESFSKLFDYNDYLDQISDSLVNGDMAVKNLHVNGNLSIINLNGKNMSEFLESCIWIDRNNNLNQAIFEGDLYLKTLTLNNFNGVDFKSFSGNIVYKTETNVVIDGYKNFLNGFRVIKMLNSEYLNGIHVDNILTKTGNQVINGPVNIYGNVIISYDTQVYDSLNGISVSYLDKTYKLQNNTCIINDGFMFSRLSYINNLVIDGFVNDVYLNEFLHNMVYKSQNSKIPADIKFLNKVQIKQNLIVTKNINDVDFSEFVQDIVDITKDDLIGGNITFTQPVYVDEELRIEQLETQFLNGIDLNSWKENAVFINQGMIPGKLVFENVEIQDNLYVDHINDIDLKSLILLKTEQNIDQSLEFLEISSYRNISVQNLVNGYILTNEFENSVLMNKPSHEVSSDIVFGNNVLVRNNLQILGLVDGHNFSNFVTTNTEQNLTANYVFDCEIVVDSNLDVTGLVNDINIKEWNERSVKTHHELPQIIYDNWTVTDGVVFGENVLGDALIHDTNIVKLAEAMEEKRGLKLSLESGIMEDYSNMCKDVNAIMSIAETQIYLFAYFDHLQTFKFSYEIETTHHFKADAQDYLIITEKNVCTSHLLAWFGTSFHEISLIRTGTISQMINVYDGDLVFLVSKSSAYLKDCRYFGTNIWKFEHQELLPLFKLENYKILQESVIPGTFYAISEDYVVEYHIITKGETNQKVYRKWKISDDAWKFVPRGVGVGLALSNGNKLLKLNRDNEVEEEEYGYETEAFIRGNVKEEYNNFIPRCNDGDIVVMNVGIDNRRRSLVAVASHEETSVKGKLDFIKIYEDIVTGRLFHKVPTYKPSSLITLEFGNNGETLLIFLENQKLLQVYEYKGIEGYKHKTSINVPGSKLYALSLPTNKINIAKYVVGVINKNEMTLLYAVMYGNQIHMNRPQCKL